ncbi:hypothetical protein [Leekyejoonella antrihumi]|uniref:Uncharacterized protein n=1 Tax=Leekyejoonella antrihumi TaxID=1660198 RepID=A0A563E600_9MICO|nr:hypothetical protein [Leekyejoonella antrihumi]TWP37621.1 hypothetical protein FGL98_05240 [Leekyejoonella antrihumi]
MSVVAILLVSLGLGDLARSRDLGRPAVAYAVAVATIVLLAVLADLHTWADILLLALTAATTVAWIMLSGRAIRTGHGERAAVASLGAGLLVVLACAGATSRAEGVLRQWLESSDLAHLQGLSADRFLLVVGLFLVQLGTGNELVRLVLAVVGAIKPAGQPQPSDRLRGGRLLGPMERVFILGLGLTGAITAAALVIAAKGLIRFPELSARRSATQQVSGVGIDEVTEYFLVGSFVSWLVALSALGLAYLA